MNIRIATTDAEIAACYPVMHEQRPHIAEEQFLSRVRLQAETGYRLALLEELGENGTKFGFRETGATENLPSPADLTQPARVPRGL